MAKTRRKKINTSPRTVFGRQSRPAAVEAGHRIKTSGIRKKPEETKKASADAKPIFISRVYTGVNKGRVYPYAGAKRGGAQQPRAET
jgi:hypothetical protein